MTEFGSDVFDKMLKALPARFSVMDLVTKEMLEEAPRLVSFCCLVTGIEVVVGPFGDYGLMQPTDPPWPLWVPRRVFESYRDFCEGKGHPRGHGPFHWNAESLPKYMGGTGKLSEEAKMGFGKTQEEMDAYDRELEVRYGL